jgi:hypothetical protein
MAFRKINIVKMERRPKQSRVQAGTLRKSPDPSMKPASFFRIQRIAPMVADIRTPNTLASRIQDRDHTRTHH